MVEVVKDKPRKTKAGEGPLQVSKDTEDGSGNGASGSSADSRTVKKVVRELDYCQMLNRCEVPELCGAEHGHSYERLCRYVVASWASFRDMCCTHSLSWSESVYPLDFDSSCASTW